MEAVTVDVVAVVVDTVETVLVVDVTAMEEMDVLVVETVMDVLVVDVTAVMVDKVAEANTPQVNDRAIVLQNTFLALCQS